jgi:hypothetical protein
MNVTTSEESYRTYGKACNSGDIESIVCRPIVECRDRIGRRGRLRIPGPRHRRVWSRGHP